VTKVVDVISNNNNNILRYNLLPCGRSAEIVFFYIKWAALNLSELMNDFLLLKGIWKNAIFLNLVNTKSNAIIKLRRDGSTCYAPLGIDYIPLRVS